jgi:hypothetical protein
MGLSNSICPIAPCINHFTLGNVHAIIARMPNYARQSCLDLDEMFGDYIKDAGNAAAMMRNIRTKERMNSAVSDSLADLI